MLLVSGPNVMKGYFNRPDLTGRVVRDGWYVTGDIAVIDADGFIRITGRQSRFSKIGGEMVPHIKIEETLQRVVGAGEDELKVVVTAVPDSKKGERLVVLHKPLEKSPHEICKELHSSGLPNLWIPSPDSFCEVDDIPVLGTGKLDLKGLKDLALEKFSEGVEA
jgi:acyl-[acyl-carrier-protein]-phospholipid O-acyltransferase/long-chain-fatty-acid--[acyl-carrier-protein] ligase